MSLIRALSNPESLYIWGDSDGFYSLCHNFQFIVLRGGLSYT